MPEKELTSNIYIKYQPLVNEMEQRKAPVTPEKTTDIVPIFHIPGFSAEGSMSVPRAALVIEPASVSNPNTKRTGAGSPP